MYAYKQKTAYREPVRVRKQEFARPKMKRKVVKKRNPILNFISRAIALTIIGSIAYFVLPQVTNKVYYQPYIKRNIQTTTAKPTFLASSSGIINSNVDIRDIINPPNARVFNALFMDEYLQVPVNKNNREISSF